MGNIKKINNQFLAKVFWFFGFSFLLFAISFISKDTPMTAYAIDGVSDKCERCLSRFDLDQLKNGINLCTTSGEKIKTSDICVTSPPSRGTWEASLFNQCSRDENKKYIDHISSTPVSVFDEGRRLAREKAVYDDSVSVYPEQIPAVWTTGPLNSWCLPCITGFQSGYFGTKPYTARKKCIENKMCTIVPGVYDKRPPKPVAPPGADEATICPIDTPSCKNCTLVQMVARSGCKGLWEVKLKEKEQQSAGANKQRLAELINTYLLKNYPTSKFLDIKNIDGESDPGTFFVGFAYAPEYHINPLVLLALSKVTTNMATDSSPSMKCLNPWRQRAIAGAPACESGGASWYDFQAQGLSVLNKQFSHKMLVNQTDRIKNTYVNDYTIRNLDMFVDKYNEKNPLPDGTPNVDKVKFGEAMQELIGETKSVFTCSSGNSRPQTSEEWVEILQQAEEITKVPWEFVGGIFANETTFGRNMGQCSYYPPTPEGGLGVLSARGGERAGGQDSIVLKDIVTQLSLPLNQIVSCNPDGECCGGAMGFAQVMPPEWKGKATLIESSTGTYPSPWNALDAAIAAGYVLKDKGGIAAGDVFPEDRSTMDRAAGYYNGAGPGSGYAVRVLASYDEIKATGVVPCCN